MKQTGKSIKVFDSTMRDIKQIAQKKVWKNNVVVDQAVKMLKKNVGIKEEKKDL